MSDSYISISNQRYLEIMKDIYDISNICETKTYIWGGFVIDILEGAFLREHGDLHGFIEKMTDKLDNLILAYKSKGYSAA